MQSHGLYLAWQFVIRAVKKQSSLHIIKTSLHRLILFALYSVLPGVVCQMSEEGGTAHNVI